MTMKQKYIPVGCILSATVAISVWGVSANGVCLSTGGIFPEGVCPGGVYQKRVFA